MLIPRLEYPFASDELEEKYSAICNGQIPVFCGLLNLFLKKNGHFCIFVTKFDDAFREYKKRHCFSEDFR
jgi:hypothetical protein